jgi:hypothetical protein
MGLTREWVKFHVSTGFLRASAGVSDPQTTLIDAKSVDYFGCPETVIDAESLLDLCRRVERKSSPASETAMGLLLQGESGELMRYFGQWLQAVLDGELVPFKLRPMLGYSFKNVRLKRFAFRRDQIQPDIQIYG